MSPLIEHSGDTIVAVSTPRGYSGIGVVRMSGPEAFPLLSKIFHPAKDKKGFADRHAVYGIVCQPDTGTILDDGIALTLKGPATYTGEDTVELSLHGSPTVLDLVVRTLIRLGARPAARGEFTRRAFLAGKLDLVQAEAVIDLIEAPSPAAAREARSRLDQGPSRAVKDISSAIKDLLADLEAWIDFDEDEEEPAPDPFPVLHGILRLMDRLREDAQRGRILRQGIKTAIVGKPNVGKSTLFNALLGNDRVIVTPVPGTTRDPVEEALRMGEVSFVVTDTAGIREARDPIEEESIRRTLKQIAGADLVIAVFDGASPLDKDDRCVAEACREKTSVVILNKMDLGLVVDRDDLHMAYTKDLCLALSAKTGQGVDQVRDTLQRVGEEMANLSDAESPGSLNERCLLLVEEARRPLVNLLEGAEPGRGQSLEIVSLELRRSLAPLEEITGERVDEGILERIFERFCVGK